MEINKKKSQQKIPVLQQLLKANLIDPRHVKRAEKWASGQKWQKERFGVCRAGSLPRAVYDRLSDVLLNGRSFAQIGASQFPLMPSVDAAQIVLGQFVMALELLLELNAQKPVAKNVP